MFDAILAREARVTAFLHMRKKGGRHFSWDECKSRINQPRLRCCVREGRSRSMILVLMSGNNHAVDYIILLQRITLEDRTRRNRYALFVEN